MTAPLTDVEEALKDVVDPELGINVVDLGLVYGIHVDDDNVATIDMTLTSAACPLTDVIEDQTRAALTTGPGGGLVNDFRINWVWLPPWGPDKITDEGLITSLSAYFGAVPWVASKTAALSPMFAPGAIPRPPTCAAAASEK